MRFVEVMLHLQSQKAFGLGFWWRIELVAYSLVVDVEMEGHRGHMEPETRDRYGLSLLGKVKDGRAPGIILLLSHGYSSDGLYICTWGSGVL